MNRTDAPKKQPVPFGINGSREDLLATTPAGDNQASYDAGFPPVTLILKSAGGRPPKGQDMNQILFELSAIGRWLSAGALNTFDATFATAIAGYPKGAVLLGDDGATIYVSTADANTNNPNSVSTGWLNLLSFLGGAPLASPTFTGDPKAPTPTAGDNDTSIATTAFVTSAIAATSGRLMGTPKLFTASGTYTPTSGCKLAVVEMVGGGGGGGGCYLADSSGASAGGGGGSGGYSFLVVSNPTTTTVTIGTGGEMGAVAANASPSPGSTGGDTTFGALATAKGGRGGLSAGWAVATGSTTTATSDGGGGGSVGTGTYSIAGGSGQRGMQLLTNGSAGYGADSKLGNGGFYTQGTGSTLVSPTKGGGGAGNYRASATTYPGSNGADGFCIVWEYF